MRVAARVGVLLVAVALGAVALAGCTGGAHPKPTAPPQVPVVQITGQPVGSIPPSLAPPAETHLYAPLVPLTQAAVLDYCPDVKAEHFAGVVLAVELVYICRADGRRQTDGLYTYGPWETAVQVLSPATLLRSYAVADAPQSTAACTVAVTATDPMIIWVRKAGVSHAYYAPVNVCGWPQARAAQDYARASEGRELVEIDVGALAASAAPNERTP